MDDWRVELVRGCGDNRIWVGLERKAALRKALALARLHSCDWATFPFERVILVDASDWYSTLWRKHAE